MLSSQAWPHLRFTLNEAQHRKWWCIMKIVPLAGFRSQFRLAVRNTSVALTAALTLSLAAPPEAAKAAPYGATIIVGSDQGGFIRARLREIDRIRARHQRVEIRGRVCLSSCTMYLAVEDVCVSPQTSFGFHAPGMAFGSLTPEQADYLSRLIASYYPPVLADWYLAEGRKKSKGMFRVSGANLIALGVPACASLASRSR